MLKCKDHLIKMGWCCIVMILPLVFMSVLCYNTHSEVDGWTDGRTDRRTNGWTTQRTNGQTEGGRQGRSLLQEGPSKASQDSFPKLGQGYCWSSAGGTTSPEGAILETSWEGPKCLFWRSHFLWPLPLLGTQGVWRAWVWEMCQSSGGNRGAQQSSPASASGVPVYWSN